MSIESVIQEIEQGNKDFHQCPEDSSDILIKIA